LWPSVSVALGTFLASTVIAAALGTRSGLGLSDLPVFAFWTGPFSVLVSVVHFFVAGRLRAMPIWSILLAAMFLGVLVSLAWVQVVSTVLGPWFGTFGIPVSICWLGGAAAGLLSGLAASGAMGVPSWLISTALILTVSLGLGMKADVIAAELTGEQKIEVMVLRVADPGETLSLDERAAREIGRDELSQLEAAGVRGRLELTGGGHYGHGRRSARVVLVVTEPIDQKATLPLPDGTTAIYIQKGKDWGVYPPGVPTLVRSIRIEPATPTRTAYYVVELADGSEQGGGV
jgi:hypothetical protein